MLRCEVSRVPVCRRLSLFSKCQIESLEPSGQDDIKELYKTAWEMKQKNMIDMAADRGAFIDQSQSLNIFMEAPSFGKLTSMHFYCWRKGLKTGMCVSSSAHAQLRIRKMHSEPSRRLRRIGCSLSARLDADGSVLAYS